VNVPTPVKNTYTSHITAVFLLLVILFMIWLDQTGRLKSVMGVVSAPDNANALALSELTGTSANTGSASNKSEIAKALKAAGFDSKGVNTMLAIGMAESGLRTNATADTPKEYSVGPFQINLKAHKQITEAEARNPVTAAAFAYQLSGGGKNYTPWTTYTSGKYKRYLAQ
jgi:hypothetical protein